MSEINQLYEHENQTFLYEEEVFLVKNIKMETIALVANNACHWELLWDSSLF